MPNQPGVNLCREPDCGHPALDQVNFCAAHIATKRQCKAHRTQPPHERCRNAAMPGLLVCGRHGGALPNAVKMSNRALAIIDMQRFVRPYEGEMDPVHIFEREFRYTMGRIEWLNDQLGRLLDPRDLIWGVSKEETITAGEFPGTNTTNEAKIHVFEEMLRWERRHLLDLEKLWIGAKLDTAKLQLMRSYMLDAKRGVLAAFQALEIDVSDPKVQAVIESAFNPDRAPSATPTPQELP